MQGVRKRDWVANGGLSAAYHSAPAVEHSGQPPGRSYPWSLSLAEVPERLDGDHRALGSEHPRHRHRPWPRACRPTERIRDHAPPFITLLLLGLLSLAVPACGGDDDDDGGGLSKEEYITQADAICKEADQRESEAGAPGATGEIKTRVLEDVVAIDGEALAELRQLEAPEEDAERWRRLSRISRPCIPHARINLRRRKVTTLRPRERRRERLLHGVHRPRSKRRRVRVDVLPGVGLLSKQP